VFTGMPLLSSDETPLEKLRAKYRWQSIYIMKLALQSVTYLLNDPAKYQVHSTKPGAEPGLSLLKKFLDDHSKDRQYEEVAFLQINLTKDVIKAGYKIESDFDGVIHETNWVGNEVEAIAFFCDGYLSGTLAYANARKVVAGGNPVHGWREMEKLRSNPFIPNEALVPLYYDLHRSVKANAVELDKLKSTDEEAYNAIKVFEKNLDKNLGAMPNNAGKFKAILLRLDSYHDDIKELSDWQTQRWQKVLEAIPGIDPTSRAIEFRPLQKMNDDAIKLPGLILPRMDSPGSLPRIHRDVERIPNMSKSRTGSTKSSLEIPPDRDKPGTAAPGKSKAEKKSEKPSKP
jgi:hypothetical protein